MSLVARPLDLSGGADTIFGFSPVSATRFKKTAVILGRQPPAFLVRYVSLGAPSPYDISIPERDAIVQADLVLVLVQHAHGPDGHPWTASEAQGHRDAAAAIAHAKSIGYLPGCTIFFDLEDCANVGQPVIDHATAWALDIAAAGFSPGLYVGYAAGLKPAQLAALPFDAYWSDAGSRDVSPKRFAMKQHLQTSTAGVGIDPDEVLIAGAIVGLAWEPDPVDVNVVTSDAAAQPAP